MYRQSDPTAMDASKREAMACEGRMAISSGMELAQVEAMYMICPTLGEFHLSIDTENFNLI
jgi:hypothetical protein